MTSLHVQVEQAVARGLNDEQIIRQCHVPLKTVKAIRDYLEYIQNEPVGGERVGRVMRRDIFGTRRKGDG